jgi:guanosine-3',5'-bis(diphosphate) 3'-pyrophosphohydrolase
MSEDGATPAPATAQVGHGVRARLARLGGTRSGGNPVLEPLLRAVKATHPKSDLSVIERAYEVAERAHRGQRRKSGDDYITHPLAVATILAELGMTPPTIAAALLHDTVEDTPYSLEELRRDFGEEIAMLVDGVTKLDKVTYGEAAQAETVRKMIVAMARDIRVLVIKLADRLHNARTWRYVDPASANRKAAETLEIYAPLAHRLGMNTIKWELEDLSFAQLYPKIYDEIVRMVAQRAPAREEYLAKVRSQIAADLKAAKIKAVVTGRPKHYYSVYQKMIVRGRDFEQIYDLVAVRVLVDTVQDCYAVLGALHARWNPVPGRFKDYIAMPKFNMYQSLHTTVIGPEGKPVEVQIRTHQMHRRAEYGVAAHWKYKEEALAGQDGGKGMEGMAWLRQLLDWQRETADPGEFLESLRFEINAAEVYVFTPEGDVMALPAGATPVDFAYAVHTQVGHQCIGARVNGKLVPLDSTLTNGDVVEILTSKSDAAGPSRDWLNFVKSARAQQAPPVVLQGAP